MNSEQAEILALKALTWLAEHDDYMGRFCAMSGLAPEDLLKVASQSETLGGLLDFLLSDDEILMAFCETAGLNPEIPFQARRLLPGGDVPHWT